VRPLNDTATVVDIDPTKYYIRSSSHHYASTESSALVDYDNNENSASFSAQSSSPQDQSTRRPHRIAYSARNVASDNVRDVSSSENRCRSSTYLEAWQSGRRGRVAGVPPTSRRSTQSTEASDIALSDLNLTNSMTSLIQSGSTSAHAWPSMLASDTSLVQPEDRKPPPSGGRQGRMVKRRTRRLEADDQQTSVSSNSRVLQRRPCPADVFPPVNGGAADINLKQRSASSSAFPPPRGTEEHVLVTTTSSPFTNGILRRPTSVGDVPGPDHEAPKPSVPVGLRDNRSQLRLALFCPPERLVNGSVPSVAPRHRPVIQDARRCTSHTDFKYTASQSKSLATTGTKDQGMTVEPRPQAHPAHVNMISRRLKATQRTKAVSLVQVTSTPQTHTTDPAPQSRLPASVWDCRDVINMADTAVGVTCSHDSLSDEGYQTKDSGSMSSLNHMQSSVRGCVEPFYPVYV